MNEYNTSSLNVLKGLEPVRVHPGMYTDTQNPNHIAQEPIDNSLDEALAGYANTIKVTILEKNGICIEDNGRGMPVDIHKEYGISGVELIMTKLHAGGKFNKKNYTFSGGLHGVGISVTNALSSEMQVEVKRNGKHYQMAFSDGSKTSELIEIGSVGKKNTGTKITFYPDSKFFDNAKFDINKLKKLLQAKAVLCPKLTIEFYNTLNDEQITWYYENGLLEYFQDRLDTNEFIPNPPWVSEQCNDEFSASWALTWTPNDASPIVESYVNLVPTQYGGTHVNGLKNGINSAIKQYCETHDLLPRNLKIKPEDVFLNCNFILSVKMQKPQFAGQTKDKLTAKSILPFVSKTVEDSFIVWLNTHMDKAAQLIDIIIEIAQKRQNKAKKVVRKKILSGPALPGKLTDCTNPYDTESELFLVEGDSAGGSARQARDREFQAVLPLRGKILNTWEVNSDQVLASSTVHDIAIAIGVDPNSDDLSKCRYGKICILADADSDGNHISTLLCALFFRHFLPLVKDGRVFVAMPPLYRIDIGKTVHYALDNQEKNSILSKLDNPDKAIVQRFKGLGEMNPSQLRETTMAFATRRLVQLTLTDDLSDSNNSMDLLLAKKRSDDRRQWLELSGSDSN